MGADPKILRAMTWCGAGFLVLLVIGQWVIAGFVPPPSPASSTQEIVNIYAAHQFRIRIGLVLVIFGAALLGPFCVALAFVQRRMEGGQVPLAWLQVAFGGVLVIEFVIPVLMWQAAAFRPTENPEITQRLHDLGSITYVGVPTTAAIQAVIFGISILRERRERRTLPRWLAYLSFWAGLIFLPGAFNPLFMNGPLAWDGILSWWVPLATFGLWLVAVIVLLLRDAIPAIAEDAATIAADVNVA